MNLRSIVCLFLVLMMGAGLGFAQSGASGGSRDAGSAPSDGESSGESGSGDAGMDFGFDLGLGVQTFEDPATGESQTYQQLSLRPDIALGKFGIGVNVQLHYRFVPEEDGDGTKLEIRKEDWVPAEEQRDFQGVVALYLPKIDYVRWAQKGDPLFAKFGSIDNSTLGNGFIMGNYSNMQFLPDRRILGLNLDVDGRLFDFPYVGVETAIGNIAAWDVLGFRLFGRPILFLDVPIVKNLEVGTTFVRDGDPYYHAVRDPDFTGDPPEDTSVGIWGLDYQLPLLSSQIFTLAQFGDFVVQGDATGGMLGIGGTAFGFMPYGAQLRFLGDDFIPVYFDSTYDLYRVEKYMVYSDDPSVPEVEGHVGYFASLGFSFLEDRIVFTAGIDGPIGETAGVAPQVTGGLTIGRGLIPGFSAQANYTKQDIAEWADFASLDDSVIDARINYQTGPAVISLVYKLRYDPFTDETSQDDPWVVTSGLETSISLF
ncbi:MAG: hypothetical protein ACOCYG_02810 [Spirochaetota bacterium]